MKCYIFHSIGSVSTSGSVQLIVDSDLNGENPQFTLTCITTGGPATNVTWTRDSEEISGGMTVLDNAMTAQYTHTVTVTGRLGGKYVCTVSNEKPSQASASYTVEGNAKLRLLCVNYYCELLPCIHLTNGIVHPQLHSLHYAG